MASEKACEAERQEVIWAQESGLPISLAQFWEIALPYRTPCDPTEAGRGHSKERGTWIHLAILIHFSETCWALMLCQALIQSWEHGGERTFWGGGQTTASIIHGERGENMEKDADEERSRVMGWMGCCKWRVREPSMQSDI